MAEIITSIHVLGGVDYVIDVMAVAGGAQASIYERGQLMSVIRRASIAEAELDAGYAVGLRARQRQQ